MVQHERNHGAPGGRWALCEESPRARRGHLPVIDNPDAAENALAQLIRQAQEMGQADAGADARTEAISLLAMTATMGTSILVGQRTPESAIAALHYHLDRIFNRGQTSPTTR